MAPDGASPLAFANCQRESDLRRIVGTSHAWYANGSLAFVEPGTESELSAVLAYGDRQGLRVAPQGGGTKTSWGNPSPETNLILSTRRLNRIVEYEWADLTVTVEAGCTVAALQDVLAEHGQRVAIDPLWPERATIGGMLSTNDSGALRLGFGGLRDLVIGITLCLPDGTLARSGGKVVKNVAGYDLPKLATGALGTLGIITRAVFRVHPVPQSTQTLSISLGATTAAQTLLTSVHTSKLRPVAFQVRLGSTIPAQAEILFEGTSAGVAFQTSQLRQLVGDGPSREESYSVWSAREQLWQSIGNYAIAKLSVLPSDIARVSDALKDILNTRMEWQLLWYATGIGWLRIEGASAQVQTALTELRRIIEDRDGSLFIARQPAESSVDAWGTVGAAKEVMRAVKNQFDPRGTLNHRRFVDGI